MLWPSVFCKIDTLLTARRVFLYAVALALITNAIGVALYIRVPSFGERPGADFVQFYSAALLLRDDPGKVYDLDAQREAHKRISGSTRREIHWPYVHAPFFTAFLIPLGFFSYAGAFWVWTVFTVILYGSSVALLSGIDSARGPPLGLALAAAYAAPVLYWLVLTGQTTAIALSLCTVVFVLLKQGRLFAAGIALGLLSYRPQYLILIVPLFAVGRFWFGLFGFAASCLILFAWGGLMLSFDAYWQYIDAVLYQSRRLETLHQPVSHYVTLYGFFRPFLSHNAAVGWAVAGGLPLIYWLLKSWRNPSPRQATPFDLQWALAVVATLLIMHHGIVYDLLLLTVPMLLLYPYRSMFPRYYKIVLMVLYFVPYILLIFPGKFPFNPIQPLLYWLCFQIYRIYTGLQSSYFHVDLGYGMYPINTNRKT